MIGAWDDPSTQRETARMLDEIHSDGPLPTEQECSESLLDVMYCHNAATDEIMVTGMRSPEKLSSVLMRYIDHDKLVQYLLDENAEGTPIRALLQKACDAFGRENGV